MPYLDVTYGGNRFTLYAGKKHDITMGRLPDNDLVLSHPGVSKIHGRITWDKNTFAYIDVSTNGTMVQTLGQDSMHIKKARIELSGNGYISPHGQPKEILFSVCFEKEELDASGTDLLEIKDYPLAFRFFEQKIAQAPDEPDNYYFSGFAAAKLNDPGHAAIRFEKYLAFRPFDTNVLYDLGKVYEKNGRINLAITSYEKVLSVDTSGVDADTRKNAELSLSGLSRFHKTVRVPPSADRDTMEIPPPKPSDISHTAYFSISFLPEVHGSMMEDIRRKLDKAHETIGRYLEFFPSERVPVKLIKQEKTISGRTTSSGITLNITPSSLDEKPFLDVLILHEYVHFCLAGMTMPGAVIPWWIHEGTASFLSSNVSTVQIWNINRQLKREGLSLPVKILSHLALPPHDPVAVRVGRPLAHIALEHLVDTHGRDTLHRILKPMARGTEVGPAFREAGLDFDAFDAEACRLFKSMLKNHRSS